MDKSGKAIEKAWRKYQKLRDKAVKAQEKTDRALYDWYQLRKFVK